MVATSAAELPDQAHTKTGAWLSEIAIPYVVFVSNGYDVTLATPKGGEVPVDQASMGEAKEGPAAPEVQKFLSYEPAQQQMKATVPLSKIESIGSYNAIFFAGGHGASVDFPTDTNVQRLLKEAADKGVIISAVCHGNAAFAGEEGKKLIKGKKVSVFSDEEERAVGKESVVPFMLETALRDAGANVDNAPAMQEQAIKDGKLITGQNPASAFRTASLVVESLTAPEPAGPRATHPGSFSAQQAASVLGVSPVVPPAQEGEQRGAEHGVTVIQAASGGVAPLETEGEGRVAGKAQSPARGGLFAP